jgi:hypothetical protein
MLPSNVSDNSLILLTADTSTIHHTGGLFIQGPIQPSPLPFLIGQYQHATNSIAALPFQTSSNIGPTSLYGISSRHAALHQNSLSTLTGPSIQQLSGHYPYARQLYSLTTLPSHASLTTNGSVLGRSLIASLVPTIQLPSQVLFPTQMYLPSSTYLGYGGSYIDASGLVLPSAMQRVLQSSTNALGGSPAEASASVPSELSDVSIPLRNLVALRPPQHTFLDLEARYASAGLSNTYASPGGRTMTRKQTGANTMHSAYSMRDLALDRNAAAALERGVPMTLPAILALPEDHVKLSIHQCFLRKQIQAFQASVDDVTIHTRGRNKPISLNQVGIQCRHCAHLPVNQRQKGSTYFPASIMGLYQAAQNMSVTHMQTGTCSEMTAGLKQELVKLGTMKVNNSTGGRPYWAHAATKIGLVDSPNGIRFIRDPDLGKQEM